MTTMDDRLSADYAALASTAGQQAVQSWQTQDPALFGPYESAAQIVTWLRACEDPAACNQVLRALLTLRAQGDQSAGTVVVQAVLPLVWASRIWSPPQPVPGPELERARCDLITSLWLVMGEWRGTWHSGIASGLVRRAIAVTTEQTTTKGSRLPAPALPIPPQDLPHEPVMDHYPIEKDGLAPTQWISDVLTVADLTQWAQDHRIISAPAGQALQESCTGQPLTATMRQRKRRALTALAPRARHHFPALCATA